MFRSFHAACAALAIALAACSTVHARDTHTVPANTVAAADPQAIWAELLAGNQRFRSGEPRPHAMTPARFAELSKGQHPRAIVLTCSDSRVPPELIFDQGVGDVFVIRLAGNVAAKAAIGSVEYAAEHLGTRLLVVLGHTKCGAVSATAEAGAIDANTNLGCILADIAPAVASARQKGGSDEVGVAVHENAKLVASALVERSEVLQHLVHERKLEIVTAVYDIANGTLQVEPQPAATVH